MLTPLFDSFLKRQRRVISVAAFYNRYHKVQRTETIQYYGALHLKMRTNCAKGYKYYGALHLKLLDNIRKYHIKILKLTAMF